jgi:hypothetical protein
METSTQLGDVEVAITRTFRLFSRLPQELQDSIWEYAIDLVGPRVVEPYFRAATWDAKGTRTWPLTSSCPIPSVLHACRSSRRLALKYWKLSFAKANQPAAIFFNFSNDILFFGQQCPFISLFSKNVSLVERSAVQKLSFSLYNQGLEGYYYDGDSLATVLHNDFPCLELVVFAGEDDDDIEERYGARRSRLRLVTRDPKKKVIIFYENPKFARGSGGIFRRILSNYDAKCSQEGWRLPQRRFMACYRSRPNSVEERSP